MESDDLIEISAEDDSLLSPQQLPTAEISSSNNSSITSFFCSPLLQIPSSTRSRPLLPPISSSSFECAKNGGDAIQISPSSSHGGNAKESVKMSNSEDPKLGVDRQKMKRKKGGGYNLRKSLAWDRAFFTEEGVLDPLELSILSGNVDASSRERLSVIHEEVESVSQILESVCESPNSQALDDSSIRKSPASTPKHKKIEGLSSLRSRPSTKSQASASSSAAKLKATPGRDAKHSGYPRPVVSSSLKRPLQLTASKVANKDPKVSKVSIPKPNLPLSPANAKSSTSNARTSKHNQISQPGAAVHARKTMGRKGNLVSAKIPQNDRKPNHAGKPTIRSTVQASRHVVKSVPEMHSQANRKLFEASNADCGLRVLKNPAVVYPTSCGDGSVTKDAESVSQNANWDLRNTQKAQIQPAKPSGLRMPSPSLRYFDQSKPSGSQGLTKITSQPGNVPLSGTPSYQKPPRPPRGRAVHLGTKCTALSSINVASPAHITPDLEMKEKVNEETQVFHNSKSCDTVNCEQSSDNINDSVNLLYQDCLKFPGIVQIAQAEDIELRTESNSLFLQCVKEEVLTEDNSNKPTNCSLKNPDTINLPVQTEVFASKACIISSQNAEGGEASVSGRVHTQRYQYVEGAVDHGTSKVPEDQISSGDVHNKKSREGHLKLRNDVEGGEYSEFGRSNCTEDAINGDIVNVPKDQLCRIPTTDRSYLDSNAETPRPYATSTEESRSSNEISQRQNLKVLDPSLKVEECTAGESDSYGFCFSHEECRKKVPDEMDSNCEAGTQIEQPRLAPSGFLPINSGLSLDRKAEAGILEVVTTCDTDTCLHSDVLCQRGLDISVMQDQVCHDVQPEGASGHNDVVKNVIFCSEASRPSLLQLKKISDLTVDPENQTHKYNNSTNTRVCASGESESEIKTCGQSQSKVMKLENKSDGDQNLIEETVAGDAELHDSHGGSFVDMSNIIITCKPQERCEKSNMFGQPQFQVFKPETLSAGNQDMIEETFMEDAGVQESDNRFVDKSNAIKCEMHVEYEENNMSGQSQSEAMEPENEFLHAVEQTIMRDEEARCSDGNFVGFSNVIDYETHKGKHTEWPKADHFVEVPSDNWVTCLSDSLLHPRISSAESQDKDATGKIFRFPLERYAGSFGSKSFNASVDAKLMLQEVTPNEVKKRKCRSADEKSWRSIVIQQPYENSRARTKEKRISDDQFSNQSTLSLVRSVRRISGHETPVTAIPRESTSDNEKLFPAVNPRDSFSGSMVQDMDIESPRDYILAEVDRRSDIDSEVDNDLMSSAVKTKIQTCIKPDNEEKGADAPAIRPPPDAAPFSDEWLAAIEAAGEEILTKKSGAVQHSPPDKSQPEPGPWSPVKKRKNQGPFDCTKYTNKNDPSA